MLIHKFKLDDNIIVLDVNSGAVHLIDQMIYDILDVYQGDNPQMVYEKLAGQYQLEDLQEAIGELESLQKAGLLFSKAPEIPEVFKEQPIVKSLCLHVAHDCNLRCGYCFASTGDFGTSTRSLMSKEVGEKAIEFAIAGSQKRHNLEIDFFGGEPLMNWSVNKYLIEYARRREQETGKNIKLTLTTNATLLTEEIIEFLNKNRVMLVISIDGRKEVHDRIRPYEGGVGSYDKAVAGFKKVVQLRGDKNYYVRGTYTRYNLDFAQDVLDMAKLGKEISVEPVVGTTEAYALQKEDLPILYAEYEKLARAYLQANLAGEGFNFFHFNVALDGGPCLNKRLSGCGAGHEYFAVTPEGVLYPCHQFVGREEYLLGNLDSGVQKPKIVEEFRNAHILNKPDCLECWARYHCSGGCHANAQLINGDIYKPYELGCDLQRKRLECAILLQAVLAEAKIEREKISNFSYK